MYLEGSGFRMFIQHLVPDLVNGLYVCLYCYCAGVRSGFLVALVFFPTRGQSIYTISKPFIVKALLSSIRYLMTGATEYRLLYSKSRCEPFSCPITLNLYNSFSFSDSFPSASAVTRYISKLPRVKVTSPFSWPDGFLLPHCKNLLVLRSQA